MDDDVSNLREFKECVTDPFLDLPFKSERLKQRFEAIHTGFERTTYLLIQSVDDEQRALKTIQAFVVA